MDYLIFKYFHKMNKIKYILLCLCLIFAVNTEAQLAKGRTKSTIIADALAQLPAETPQQYNIVIADLVTTGEEGILDLIGRMNPPGIESNELYEFALNGWSHYVSRDNVKRKIAANSYEKALGKSIDKEIKAFVIRQLRTVGSDDNIYTLSSFLEDDYLSGAAAAALVSIGTNNAGDALIKALLNSNSETIKLHLVNALGQLNYTMSESVMLNLLRSNPSDVMKDALLKALANVGGKESLKPLREAAEKVDLNYSKSNGTDNYINLLNRLKTAESKTVKKEASRLLSKAKKLDKYELKIAATNILLELPNANYSKILKGVINNGDIRYITNVLNAYTFENDSKSVDLILKEIASNRIPEVQTALIYWLGKNNISGSASLLTPLTGTKNKMALNAVTQSLAKIGGEDALFALTSLLKSSDEETVTLAKNALMSYDGDISNTIASVFNSIDDFGKKAVLELISNRMVESQYDLVYNQMLSNNKVVKAVAANTLKNVVTDKNLNDLFTLLEQSETENASSIQISINSALKYLIEDEQIKLVTERINKSNKKHLYYSALAGIGSENAIKQIIAAYNKESGTNRESAFNALLSIKSFNAIYPILDIARSTDNKSKLEKITDALIDIIRISDETEAVKYRYLRETMQFAQNDKQKNSIISLIGNTRQYPAMLYVASFMDNTSLSEAAALASMNIALSDASFAGVETTKILNEVYKTLSNPDADYQRQSITKYLSENPINEPYKLTVEEELEGFRILFDGTSLDEWVGNKEEYIIENGTITVYPNRESRGTTRNLYTKDQFGDFIFRFEFMLTEGANNGLGIRTPMEGDPAYVGMELQILDNDATIYDKLNEYQYHGSVYGVIPAKKGALKPLGEWNYQEVIADGDNIKVILNDKIILNGNIHDASRNGTLDGRNHPGLLNKEGYIGFLGHGSKIKLRNIRIKEI